MLAHTGKQEKASFEDEESEEYIPPPIHDREQTVKGKDGKPGLIGKDGEDGQDITIKQ
ncbi:MAG: hypothetical protein N4Q32_01830 [Neisseriaceae bacterium]|nr:hypothetical protein [Neisseriaceae bacterium PsAf]MCV2503292.1 hypothetical protein [Neisseriaceae bacterium]MCV2509160.1 hypothetical protein [Neisseriaceae bacterium]